MGNKQTITIDKFPAQGVFKGATVRVCFHFDVTKTVNGVVVRDDNEEPRIMIIKTDDGRYILATECQWQPLTPNTSVSGAAALSPIEAELDAKGSV